MMMTAEAERTLVGLDAIADFLDRSRSTIKRIIATDDAFPARKVGGNWEAEPAELRRWRRSQGVAHYGKQ